MSPAPSAPAANQTEVEMWRKIEGPATKRRRLRVSPDTQPLDRRQEPARGARRPQATQVRRLVEHLAGAHVEARGVNRADECPGLQPPPAEVTTYMGTPGITAQYRPPTHATTTPVSGREGLHTASGTSAASSTADARS
jgi:hypothetical protein